MKEITFGNDDSTELTDYEHIYEVDENGAPQRLITGRSKAPEPDEAADLFEVPEDNISWILTREMEPRGSVTPAAQPCDECGKQVWTTQEQAEWDRKNGIIVRCGDCAKTSHDSR